MNCPNCGAVYETAPNRCEKCNYPFSGNDEERSAFIGQQVIKSGHLTDAPKQARRAQIVVLVIGSLNLLAAIITFYGSSIEAMIEGVMIGLLGLMFIVIGIFLPKRPFPLSTIALIS